MQLRDLFFKNSKGEMPILDAFNVVSRNQVRTQATNDVKVFTQIAAINFFVAFYKQSPELVACALCIVAGDVASRAIYKKQKLRQPLGILTNAFSKIDMPAFLLGNAGMTYVYARDALSLFGIGAQTTNNAFDLGLLFISAYYAYSAVPRLKRSNPGKLYEPPALPPPSQDKN